MGKWGWYDETESAELPAAERETVQWEKKAAKMEGDQ